ncbi:MAG TPA: molybdopterin oxidoreductase family protein [Kofleriaceae bacterium]|nr:molybdopterin oxidoreductase family protein [Kofleriaceae bacterium]
MPVTHYRSCTLCEATCGVAIDIDGDQVVAIRGDDADPFSRGYICPKATALADLHHDPDRLRRPIARDGDRWRELGWDEAFDLVAGKLRATQAAHGKQAVGVYQGNPSAHNLGLLTFGQLLFRFLGTRNLFSATSADQLPHMLAALTMFGDQLLMAVPDIDRTDHMLILGGNPLVSNGSIMTAPDVKARLKAIQARGGQVVVVDPRRTETAELADRHLFIRPGTDAVFLLSLLHVLYAERLVQPGRLADFTDGVDELGRLAARFAPEVTAAATGIAPDDVRAVARAFAAAPRAVCYGRLGVCTQEFGGLAAWLCYAVNVVTGRLDAPGGLMFTTPAVDILPLARRIGFEGGYARWTSRVRGLPEFGGELPVVTLAEEIETPGPGQLRALITVAGNPVLSSPNGRRLDAALAGLDFMVSIDPYLNETTRHAHVILPPTSPLERSHYDLALAAFAVRNVAKYSPPLFARGDDQRHDWEICAELLTRLQVPAGPLGVVRKAARRALLALGPEAILEAGLRTGPHGLRKGTAGLSLAKLRAQPHGVDLGALEPRLPARLNTPGRRVVLCPSIYVSDLPRLEARLAEWSRPRAAGELTLVGRRHLRSNNSWLHNSARLVKGKPRCTLLMHPADAAARGLGAGDRVRLASRAGAIVVPVELTDEMMPGVVSLPHGWGHDRPGTRTTVATAHAGASINDVTDETFLDLLSGTAALSGVTVMVERAAAVRPAPERGATAEISG